MLNKSMERMLDKGQAFAVDEIGKISYEFNKQFGTVYEIPNEDYMGFDLCIKSTEEWIWSVGRRHSDGKVYASTSANFYQNPDFECVWLR